MLDAFQEWGEWAAFLRRPYSDLEAIAATRDRRLRRVVRHAAANVPYYRELFRKLGLSPHDIRVAADLRHLPVTGKEELRSRPLREFVADGVAQEGLIRLKTSGSTGEPTTVLRTRLEQYALQAVRLRSQIMNGLRPDDRRLTVGARWEKRHPFDRLGLFRMQFCQGDGDLRAAIRRLEPRAIHSRASTLQASLDRDGVAAMPRVPLIFLGGEVLTPAVRRCFEQELSSTVVNEYGSNELVLMAAECVECGRMHVPEDAAILEVLEGDKHAKPGEVGTVVGTALHSYAMPFLRFDLGDVARIPLYARPCSIGFTAIEVIEGRRMQHLRFADGSSVSPYVVQRIVQDTEGVRRFRVRQVSPHVVEVKIESAAGATEGVERTRSGLARVLPSGVSLRVDTTNNLSEAGDKFQYIEPLYHGTVD